MKHIALMLALSAGFLFSCDKDDDAAAKVTQTAALEGKWDAVSTETKTYSATDQQTGTINEVAKAGTQWEFISGGTFKQYTNYTVDATGTYTYTGNKIVITVPQMAAPPKYVQTLTATNLSFTDTTRYGDNTWAVRMVNLKR